MFWESSEYEQKKTGHLLNIYVHTWDSLVAQTIRSLPAMRETWARSLGQKDPLEKEMAIHSSILAWRIPWMEEPGGLQSMGSQSRTRLSNVFIFYVHTYVSKIQQQQMKNNRCWQEYGKTKTPISCQWECKAVQFLWKTVVILENLNTELPYDSIIPLLDISKRIENIRPKKTVTQKFIVSLFITNKK